MEYEFDPAVREADLAPLDEASDFAFLSWSTENRIATVVLSRPPVNALSQRAYREIHRLFSRTDRFLPDASVIVLVADGAHFCAGNELTEVSTLTSQNARERLFHARESFYAVQDCVLPTVVAIQGACIGSGVAIASSCDVMIAANDARIGMTEIKVGVMGGARHLARLLPQHIARYMFLTGELLPASEVARLGGLLETVPAGQLRERAREIAALIARHDLTVLKTAKQAINEVEELGLRAGYEREQQYTLAISDLPEGKAAVAEFLHVPDDE